MIRALILSCVALPAWADVDQALDDHVLPGMDRLGAAAAELAATPCDPAALRLAFTDAALAWAAVSHLTLGPAEAAPCALTDALADDLAATTAAIRDGWRDAFADLMRNPGAPGNTRFLSPEEVDAALYTALLTGLENVAEQRLGQPLGTFDRPRPARAELRRSALSRDMVLASLGSLRALAAILADAPQTDAALARAIAAAEALDDPAFQGVADPSGRVRVEAIQSAVQRARIAAEVEIGEALGVPAGFNSADGD